MRPILIAASAAAALAFATPALAQGSTPPGSQQHPQNGPAQGGAAHQDPAQVRQSIQHDLEQAGYTNVQVMPEAFLAHARDKQGHPVTMMIEPGSVTAITELGKSGAQTNNAPQSSGGSGSTR